MEKAKQKRTVYRSLTTKLISKVEGVIDKDDTTKQELEELFEELMVKQDQLKQLDSEIMDEITDATEIESDITRSDEYLSQTIRCKCKIKTALEKFKLPIVSTTVLSTSTSTSESKVSSNKRTDSPYVKLPLLSIEKFSGDPSDFQRFWDQYEAAIHKNPDLSDVEKFNYLKSYLTGTAANSVKGYSLTNKNYVSAVETLKDRFGKKHLVINSHLTKLLSLSPVKKSSDIYALRKLLDTCQTEIRNLEALGLKIENYSALLIPILLKLLPSDIVLEITKRGDIDEEFLVTPLIEYLKSEVISREKTAALIASQNVLSHDTMSGKNERDRPAAKTIPTAAGLINENFSISKQVKCLLCKQRHFLTDCKAFKEKEFNEKRELLRKHGCCFICLRSGHIANKCRKFIKCEGCSKRHYQIMCPEKKGDETHDNVESSALSNKTCNREVLMQTLTVCLQNGNENMFIRCLIDTGSQRSYITKQVINRMGYKPVRQEKMIHSLFGGLQETHLHKCYRIYLGSLDNTFKCNFEVYDQEQICAKVPKIKNGPWIKEAKKCGIKFSDYGNYTGSLKNRDSQDINLLIGADIYGKLLTGKIKPLSSDLVAIETKLGWSLMGKTNENVRRDTTNIVLSLYVTEAKLTDLWRLDTLGILDPGEKESRKDLEKAIEQHFNQNIKVDEDGRYEVSLPWIEGHPPLPNGRRIAERRLKNCVDSLKRSELLEDYETVFHEWLQEGVIEEVATSQETESEFFLPHRAVVKENSTTRIRPVFDGSAKEKGSPSINDCLERGPNLVELIPSIINRFRLKKIGVISDIKKAFLQIGLNENDRPFLRFLWWQDGNREELKTFQHRRVVFGLTCSPYLLGATLQYHLKNAPESMKETSSKLLESFYIDNCITSVENEEILSRFITESKSILGSAKFDLRGWEHSYFPSSTEKVLSSEDKIVPVLGLRWRLYSDTLSIDLRETFEDNEPITKRKILSTVHKIFDPVGFTCPVTLYPKVLLQECWRLNQTWDSELPSSIRKKFEKWRKQLYLLTEIAIPRCLLDDPDHTDNLSLHVFCDASKVAYATCIFLRNANESSTSCQLVQARCRVAPLKSITIPRLELLACTIGVRLAQTVKADLRLDNIPITYWTDSSNALYWIKGSENWAPFVYNRVKEIRSHSKPENWYFVPGLSNPADLPSRGCSAETLKQSRWWEGPHWLKDPPEFWPKDGITPDLEIVNSEKRKTVVTTINILSDPIELYEESHSYLKMIRVTAWIYRFFRNIQNGRNGRKLERNLSVEEMDCAERIVLKYSQRSLSGETKPCYTSLQTFQDEQGLIRVRTRISMRNDLHSFRYPIVLPCDHNITQCLILEKHRELQHAGTQIMMSVLRESFWVLKSRRTIRQVLKRCLICKRFTARPVEVLGAPLPVDRVREALVFEVVGIDLCGPLYLRDGTKSWVVLFTCAVFRAIHVELVTSLSTESFLLALRRFIARRGRPATIISDNGTNLVKASSELKSIDFAKLQEFASMKKVQWKFNPPAAPWWGGFFERMIGMLKGILRRVLGRANLQYEELYTILCDAESVINSRPLTYLSDDDDLDPITPAMFLQEIKDSRVPDIDLVDATKLKKRFAYRQKVRQDLRKRFRSEYLGLLRDFVKNKKTTDIRQGDIVLIGDDNCKRINWPLGKIQELYPGKDGIIRVVRIKTQSGSLVRPLKKIYPLEVHDNISVPILVDRFTVPVLDNSFSDAVPDDEFSAPVGRVVTSDAVPEDEFSAPVGRVVTSDAVPEEESSAPVGRSRSGRPLKRPDRLDL